jgi:hypothetical protein
MLILCLAIWRIHNSFILELKNILYPHNPNIEISSTKISLFSIDSISFNHLCFFLFQPLAANYPIYSEVMNISPSNLFVLSEITLFHCIFSEVTILETNIKFYCMSAFLFRFLGFFDSEKQFYLKFQTTQLCLIPFILTSNFFTLSFQVQLWLLRNFAAIGLGFRISTCLNHPDLPGLSERIITDLIFKGLCL